MNPDLQVNSYLHELLLLFKVFTFLKSWKREQSGQTSLQEFSIETNDDRENWNKKRKKSPATSLLQIKAL